MNHASRSTRRTVKGSIATITSQNAAENHVSNFSILPPRIYIRSMWCDPRSLRVNAVFPVQELAQNKNLEAVLMSVGIDNIYIFIL